MLLLKKVFLLEFLQIKEYIDKSFFMISIFDFYRKKRDSVEEKPLKLLVRCKIENTLH